MSFSSICAVDKFHVNPVIVLLPYDLRSFTQDPYNKPAESLAKYLA